MRQKLKHCIARLQAHLMRRFASKNLYVTSDRAVISFTFDDVPYSTLHYGAAILEKYGLRGTFYISGGLVGTSDNNRQIISQSGVRELAARGHEIGCHTFSHADVSNLNKRDLQNEIDRNAVFLNETLAETGKKTAVKLNFAYPYNAVSLTAKRLLSRNYRSCRAGENLINRGPTCMEMLFGMEIGKSEAYSLQLTRQIDAVRAQPGWLIFFTHDISEKPTPYGCTPETFEALVKHSVQSGSVILTVNEALNSYK